MKIWVNVFVRNKEIDNIDYNAIIILIENSYNNAELSSIADFINNKILNKNINLQIVI